MSLILLAAATISLPPQVEACATAVRTNLASAAQACVVPKESIDLLDPKSMSGACVDAMKAGESAGKIGSKMPGPVRSGLIREFEKKFAACAAPAPAPVQKRETVQLWN